MTVKKRLGEMLIEAGVIGETQLKAALGHQRQWGVRLGQALVDLKLATEADIVRALALKYGFDVARLEPLEPYGLEQALALLPRDFAIRNNVFPMAADTASVTVAMSDPTNLAVADEIRFRTGRRVKVCIGGDREVAEAVRRHYPGGNEVEAIALDLDVDDAETEAVFDPFGGGSKDALEAFFGGGPTPWPAAAPGAAAAPTPAEAAPEPAAARAPPQPAARASPAPVAPAAAAAASPAPAAARPAPHPAPVAVPAPVPAAAAPRAPSAPQRPAAPSAPAAQVAAAPAAQRPSAPAAPRPAAPAPPPPAAAPAAAAGAPGARRPSAPAIARPPAAAPHAPAPAAPAAQVTPTPGGAAPAEKRPSSAPVLRPAAPSPAAALRDGPAGLKLEVELEDAGAALAGSASPFPGTPFPDAPFPAATAAVAGAEPALAADPAPRAEAQGGSPARALTDRELEILAALDRLAGGGHAEPEIVRPTQAMAALVQLLLRKGLITERELVDELTRR